jgi:hypothetical protein
MKAIFKILSVWIILIGCTHFASAQNYNPVLNYNFNGTPVNGVKIKTNLPFSNWSQMPTIIIEGYNYVTSQTINLSVVWYIYEGNFLNYSASSFGSYTPEIKLSNEAGKVVIFINDRTFYQRFTVRAFAQNMAEQTEWFQGWTATDETLNGTNTVTVPYQNNFAGNVGIGTSTPQARLHLNNGTFMASDPLNNINVRINGTSIPSLRFTRWTGYAAYQHNAFIGQFHNSSLGEYSFGIGTGYSGSGDQNAINMVLTTTLGGNVGIGTTNPTSKLTVTGDIESRRVKVTINAGADFVFEEGYDLKKLEELQSYIQQHKHLPDIPSAKEMETKGIELGEMNIKLLQKIEELTLYLIEMKKENEKLKKENDKQFKKMEIQYQMLKSQIK